jgi:hypothetical protein
MAVETFRRFPTDSDMTPSCASWNRKPVKGCQMVCFQTKNTSLGIFCRVFRGKILVYFMSIWSILRP